MQLRILANNSVLTYNGVPINPCKITHHSVIGNIGSTIYTCMITNNGAARDHGIAKNRSVASNDGLIADYCSVCNYCIIPYYGILANHGISVNPGTSFMGKVFLFFYPAAQLSGYSPTWNIDDGFDTINHNIGKRG